MDKAIGGDSPTLAVRSKTVKGWCRVFRLLLCFAVLGFGGYGFTQPIEQTRVNQATALFQEGNYSEALKQYQSLLSFSESEPERIRLQWNVARCLEMIGRYEEALSGFYAYQSIVADPKRKARALEKIRALRPKVYGKLNVACEAPLEFQVLHRPTSDPESPKRFGPLGCPNLLEELTSGNVVVTANEGGDLMQASAVINPGETISVTLSPPPKAYRLSSNAKWMIGGVTTALVVGAIAYFALTSEPEDGPKTRLVFQ